MATITSIALPILSSLTMMNVLPAGSVNPAAAGLVLGDKGRLTVNMLGLQIPINTSIDAHRLSGECPAGAKIEDGGRAPEAAADAPMTDTPKTDTPN